MAMTYEEFMSIGVKKEPIEKQNSSDNMTYEEFMSIGAEPTQEPAQPQVQQPEITQPQQIQPTLNNVPQPSTNALYTKENVNLQPMQQEQFKPQDIYANVPEDVYKVPKSESDFIGGMKVLGESLLRVPKSTASSVLQASLGAEGASVTDSGWSNKVIDKISKGDQTYLQDIENKYKNKTFLPGIPIKITDIAQLPQNIGFSLTSMGAGLATGAPIAAIPVPGAQAAGFITGGAASGKVAYEMATYSIMQSYLEAKNEEQIQKTGKPITKNKEIALKKHFDSQAKKYGLWEAIPEAVSNVALVGLAAPLGKMIGKGLAGKVIGRVAGIYGEELATETITQKGQAPIEESAGLRKKGQGNLTWYEALKEVAPQTFLLSTLMAGSGAIGGYSKEVIQNSLKKEIGENQELSQKINNEIIDSAPLEQQIQTQQQPLQDADFQQQPQEQPITYEEFMAQGTVQPQETPTPESVAPSTTAPIEQTARQVIEQAGGQYIGIQEMPKGEALISYNDPQTGSTLMTKISEANVENVKNHIAESRNKFAQAETKQEATQQEIKPRAIETPAEEQELVKEARKFKSAEEFVKSKGEPVYHGTTEKFYSFKHDMGEEGAGAIWFSKSKELANIYIDAGMGKYPRIIETYVSPKKTFDTDIPEHREIWDYLVEKDKLGGNDDLKVNDNGGYYPFWHANEYLIPILKRKGFDSVYIIDSGGEDTIGMFNLDQIKTKQQLTDIWNKAQEKVVRKPVSVPKKVQPEPTAKVEENEVFDELRYIQSQLETFSKARREYRKDIETGQITGVSKQESTFPKWWQPGWTKENVNRAIDKQIKGEKLGLREQQIIDDLIIKVESDIENRNLELEDKIKAESKGKISTKEPELSGIQKELVPNEYAEKYKQVEQDMPGMLKLGIEAVDSGDIIPEELIYSIIKNNHVPKPIEITALTYYKAKLDREYRNSELDLEKAQESGKDEDILMANES